MPSIGELFVTLGAKTDSSMAEGLRKLKELGTAAQWVATSMAAGAKNTAAMWAGVTRELGGATSEMKQLGAASKVAVSDVNSLNRAMSQAAASSKAMALNAKFAVSAIQNSEAARVANLVRGGRRGGGINWASSTGNPFGGESIRQAVNNPAVKRFRSAGNNALDDMWAALSGQPVQDVNRARRSVSWNEFMGGRNFQVSPGGRSNINWGSATGDPFAPGGNGGVGGGGGRRPGARPARGPGGGGGRQIGRNWFGGPLGEAASIRRMILGAGVYQGAQFLGNIADSYTQINNRLRQVSTSEEDVNARFERLREIAIRTHSDLAKTSEAYVRITMATRSLNLSSNDQYKLMERINMAFKLQGLTSSEAGSAMIQLTQAFNKGKLDGDEFRTMAEEMPSVLDSLAKVMKKPKEELFKLSRQGKLTRDVLVKAFLENDDIEKSFAKYKTTFADQWNDLKSKIMKPIGEALATPEVQEAVKAIFELLAQAILLLAKYLPPVVKGITSFIKGLEDGKPWAIGLAVVLGTMLIPQLIAMAFWLGRIATMPFTAILGQVGRMKALMGGDFRGAAGLSKSEQAANAAGGVGGAAAKGGTGGISGLAAAAGPIGMGIAAIETAKSFGVADNYSYLGAAGGVLKGINYLRGGDRVSGLGKSVLAGAATAPNVNVGPTTVNIYANDLDQAKAKFSEEMVDRMMRHAAASLNRPGS